MPPWRVQKPLRVSIRSGARAAALAFGLGVSLGISTNGAPINFDREIRPILSDTCFQCHGPDASARKADLRLDQRDSIFGKLKEGGQPVVPGKPAESVLFQRVTHSDPDDRMPPQKTGKKLSAEQVERIRRWIEEGASWEEHWSFQPVRRIAPPAVRRAGFVRNEIDRFVLARLEQENLEPSPEADKARLIRRVTLDLTGLPPTREAVDAFVADASPQAYERVVERLLHSPQYGERMALEWLDAARYADTQGYLIDSARTMWPWRDWVIGAFNRNLPFDQFTIQQLAGDLLPSATLDEQIASGFNRNHVINSEFGAIDAEYLVENIADRVNTTATAWLGLTAQCARCHDHKFDPVSQKEYYELYAFFNNIGERGLDGLFDNAGPSIKAPKPGQSRALEELTARVQSAESRWTALEKEVSAAQKIWEGAQPRSGSDPRAGLVAYWPFDGNATNAADNTPPALEAISYGSGVFGKCMSCFGLNSVKIANAGMLRAAEPFTLAAWIQMAVVQGRRSIMTRMPDGVTLGRGSAFQVRDGHVSLALVEKYPSSCIEVETESTIPPDEWHHVAATYDGSGHASGVQIHIDGKLQPKRVISDSLAGPIDVDELLIMGDGTPNATIRGQLDEVRIYNRALTSAEVAGISGLPIASHLAVPEKERTSHNQRRIREAFLAAAAPSEWRVAYDELKSLRAQKAHLESQIPSVMVMQEQSKPSEAQILARGAYDKPMGKVTPGTPRSLPAMPASFPRNRLGLARWLVMPENPLTARVAVNRYWQMYFGAGLVRTSEDFGRQGEPPSHPELLDWLAGRFIESGWDIRAMQRLIVTSATYRQSSRVTPDLLARDPGNRLLARGPRFRLPAELIRDQALSVSGLLNQKIGGPSVKPYQPPGVWEEGAFDPTGNKWSAQIYVQDHGADLYRRSLYTFWKRTAPPPNMLLFDAPERERCVVKRNRTNTPLQALVTLNDPTFVEASRKLGERIGAVPGPIEAKLAFGFQIATARKPSARELGVLQEVFMKQRAKFAAAREAAKSLLNVGESGQTGSLDPADAAAFTAVANVLLNLDEILTKG